MEQDREEEVGNAAAELLDQKRAPAGFLADAADSDGEQENHRAEHHAFEAILKTRDDVFEGHALGEGHAHGQQERDAKCPMYFGRFINKKSSDSNGDERAQGNEKFEDVRLVALGHIAALQFLRAQRFGIVRVELPGFPRAFDSGFELLAQKQGFFNAEQKRAQHRKDGVKTERNALVKEQYPVRFRGQETDARHKDKRLHIAGPGIERELGRDGRSRGIDDIGQFLVADVLLVRKGFDRRADQYRAHRAALKENDAEHPRDQLGTFGAANKMHGHKLGKCLRRARARPNAHQPAQEPQVEHQDARRVRG